MASYNTLVSQVLQNQYLAKAVTDMAGEDCLNLVAPDWGSRLENDATYQDFKLPAKNLWKTSFQTDRYTYYTLNRPEFNVLVVGWCRFTKPFEGKPFRPAVIISDSEPLDKIAQVVLKDKCPPVQISNEFKFTFEDCSSLSCNVCNLNSAVFVKAGYKMSKINQPCILDTRVFDGKQIVNRFQSQMEDMFQKHFLALLHLKINTKYDFLDSTQQRCYRIGGSVSEIVGFNESKLRVSKNVNLGDLTPVEEPETSDCPSEQTEKKPREQKNLEINDIAGLIEFIGKDASEDGPAAKRLKMVGDAAELMTERFMTEEQLTLI